MPEAVFVIQRETPDQPDVRALLTRSDAFSMALYPPEENYLLDVAALTRPEVCFFVARRDGRAAGCGALLLHADGSGEVKRMFVVDEVRGQRLGHAILARLESEATRRGARVIRLETGPKSTAALALYRRAGYRERGPFADYPASASSVFMEKVLTAPRAPAERRSESCSSVPETS